MSYTIAKALKNKLYSASLKIGDSVRIVGIVTGYEVGVSVLKRDNGDIQHYAKFAGQFAHVFTGSDGFETEQRAGYLFVPEILESVVKGQFDSIVKGDNFQGMQIAYDLFKVADPDPKNARGYTWGCKPLIQQDKATDPLSQIFAQVSTTPQKQLENKTESKGKK